MHPDKKTEELEQKREFELLQQEGVIDAEIVEQENNLSAEELAEIEKEIEKSEQEQEEEKVEDTPVETEIERAKRKKREMIFEFALFCILGILLGVTIKTEAVKKITIGFNDYQIETGKQRYDIDAMKRSLDAQTAEQQKAATQQAPQK